MREVGRRGRSFRGRWMGLSVAAAVVAAWPAWGAPLGADADGDGAGASSKEKRAFVGAYYYPWYFGRAKAADAAGDVGWMRQAHRARLVPRQLPALGVYRSDDPAVIGAHIAQSRRAGIDFWAVSWWGPGSPTDKVLAGPILSHPEAKKLKYAVLYETTGRLRSDRRPDYRRLIPDFEYLEKTFFGHPAYLKFEGRPVVFIYLTRVYFRGRGGDALADLRRRFPRLYLVGDDVFGPGYREEWARPWDAVTAYDVYGQCLQRHGATRRALDQLRDNYATAHAAAGKAGSAFVPAVSPGFNDTAVRDGHPGRPRYFTDVEGSRPGDLFRQSIRRAGLPFLDDGAGRMLLVTSFNEWYEDTQIEPTAGTAAPTDRDDSASGTAHTGGDTYYDYGDLYLDILREEVSGAAGEPGD